MKRTAIVLSVALLGLCLMVAAFVSSASPYVTVAEAKDMKGDNLHLAGDIVAGSLTSKPLENKVFFTLRDEKQQTIPVIYHGPTPANMGEATKVVAIGKYENGSFVSQKMLLKCPSKYKSEGPKA